MSAWNTTDALITRDEAIALIHKKAEEEGLSGAFKVYYDGVEKPNPDDLPEQVDPTKLKVSAVMSQAV